MSRIGKLPISIPAGVTITHKDDIVTVKGPKGELSQYVNPAIKLNIEDGTLTLEENTEMMTDNAKQRHAFHGLYRSLLNNIRRLSNSWVWVSVCRTRAMCSSSLWVTLTPLCSRCLRK